MSRWLVAAVWALAVSPAAAMSLHDALAEVAGEFIECSVYYEITAAGISKSADVHPDAPAISAKIRKMSDDAMELGRMAGAKTGLTELGALAYKVRTMETMNEEMSYDFSNLSILSVKYRDFCKALMTDMQFRLNELQAGNLCHSTYPCGSDK
jgi:hypothetical protein